MRRISLFSAALAASIGLAGCSGDANHMLAPDSTQNTILTSGTAASIAITPATIPVGGSQMLSIFTKDAAGDTLTGLAYFIYSSDTTIATVLKNGTVTGVRAGSAQITAMRNGVSGSATVTITAAVAAPTSVTVSLAASSIVTGATTQATATAFNAAGTAMSGQLFTWTSASNAIASVSAAGLITAISAGTAVITAKSGAVQSSATITVTAPPAPAQVPPQPGANTLPQSYETFAALPQQYVSTAMPAAPAAAHQVINVSTAAQLTAALTSATYGDVIALANGVSFTGNFTLPNKGTNASGYWITIRPANMAGMPAAGQRMTPTIAASVKLPVLLSPNNMGALNTALGAHHYRIIGIEVSQTATAGANTGLVRLGTDGGNGQTTLASVAHDLVIDRAYIHGMPGSITRRCVSLNSAMSAVIDSHLGECHELGSDAQAIWGFNGPGPYKIVNNYLEASGENIMWGGVDPAIPNLVPSDIEIRHNHFFKPTSWIGKYTIKNLYESKNSMRVILEGNIFENNWQDAQNGTAINIKVANQNGTCTWCTTQDLTFRNNIIRNVGSAFVVSGSDPGVSVHSRRITITDNLVYNINVAPFIGDGRGFYIGLDPTDVSIAHNTIIAPDQYAFFMGGPATQPPVRLSIRDNIVGGGTYGVKSSGMGSGTASISPFMPLSSFVGNVLILPSAAGYPSGNYYPTSVGGVGFASASAFDFHLTTASAFRLKATDLRDPGANVDGVLTLTNGAIVP